MSMLYTFYKAQFKNSLIVQFQYRWEMAIWMVGLIVEPTIYLAVWTSVAESSGGTVGAYTAPDFAAYYLALLVVQHVTQLWDMWEFDYLIREGVMSGRLLRPIHPIHISAGSNIAYKTLMLAVIIPAVVLLTIAFQPTFTTPLWSIGMFVVAVLLAGILSFLCGWSVALAAFWTTRTFAINQLYFVATFFLSGQIAPLDLLPRYVQTVASFLPFRWFIAFPVELATGRLTPNDALLGIGIQVGWIIGMGLLLSGLWRAGVKQYTAVGG